MPGLRAPSLADIVRSDPETLRACSLEELRALMSGCGVSPEGIETVDAAMQRLIERAAIGS